MGINDKDFEDFLSDEEIEEDITESDDFENICSFLDIAEGEDNSPDAIVCSDSMMKEERSSKSSDYVDKEDLYKNMVEYQLLRDRIRSTKFPDKCDIENMNKIRSYMLKQYYKQAWEVTKCKYFRKLDNHRKSDLVTDSIIRGMSIGVQGRPNYGNEYWSRFNINGISKQTGKKNKNVFAYWTTQIRNFFFQLRISDAKYDKTKWDMLENIKGQFQYDCIMKYGCNGAQFHYGTVIDGDDR